jgi:DNA mismatch repair protein MutS2
LPHIQDYYLTERNKRWVIPVKRDSKGFVPGIVHDISNTGETVFVEPYSIQNPGNELESYRAEEKLEEYRVLWRLSALLREHVREIEEDYRIVAQADSIQAIAGFSEQMAMSPSEINEKGHMKIINGRHPLLWKTLRKEDREGALVPLDIEIGKGHSCIVITGSNAGGKTVSLKTVGVLNLMALSGMHIPAGAGTTIPFLERVLVDIGDEQSIEQNLSTFSAHITRISEIIRQSSAQTLIIIDELGTGTDPDQGGALSCAILKRLMQRGALSVVSTHIGMLKAFAHSEPGMTNSAMEMEEITAGGVSSYRPTYKFIIGEPGTSHTFEIAESLGLDADLIKEAREFINSESTAVESLISELKQKTGKLENRLKETEELKQDVINIRSSLNEEVSMIRSSKKETLSEALREAEDIIKSAGRYARDIIEKLKKAKISESKEMIKDIDRRHEDMKKIRSEIVSAKIQKLKEVKAGQHVFIKTLETNGIVHSVNERTRKCEVLVSGKEITISIKELYGPIAEISGRRSGEHVISGRSELQYAPASGDIEIPGELNVIGQRVDPAVSGVERYLNDASLANVGQIKIIHGIGTGRLSRAIRDYLKDHPLVESLRKGNEDEGGEAVTIVYL